VSDIDTAVADGLKVLDLKRPIREADISGRVTSAGSVAIDPKLTSCHFTRRGICIRLGSIVTHPEG
jgi:hypothetical protein